MRTEDDLRAALAALERHAPDAARVLPGTKSHSRHRLRAPKATSWLAGTATAAAVAGAVAALTIAAPATRTSQNGGAASPSGTINRATVQAKVLAALSTIGNEIVYRHDVSTTTDRSPYTDPAAVVSENWYYPWQADPGQRVRSRSLVYSLDGAFHHDDGISYLMPAPGTTPRVPAGLIGAFTAAAEIISVDYVSKTWSEVKNPSMVIDVPDSPAQIAHDLKTAPWTVSRATLNGRPALELTLKLTIPGNSWTTYLWVDASTYLPLSETASFGPPGMITNSTSDFQYLPATPANLAKLTVPIPAGFKRVTPDRVSRHAKIVLPSSIPTSTPSTSPR